MNKTQWLDWLEASRDRMNVRYRTLMTRAWGEPEPEEPAEEPRRWSTIHPAIDREDRGVVVHLELPEPHTVEANVRVIDSTLAITVLKSGEDLARAPAENCYRRAIPLPAQVDPRSATHQIDGDELVIRLRHPEPRRRSTRGRAAAS